MMAGEIRQAENCDTVEEKEIPAESLKGTESQQARGARTKEQWLKQCLQKRLLEGDLRRARECKLRRTLSSGKRNGNHHLRAIQMLPKSGTNRFEFVRSPLSSSSTRMYLAATTSCPGNLWSDGRDLCSLSAPGGSDIASRDSTVGGRARFLFLERTWRQ